MKKALIISSVLLFFAVTTSAQTPTYKELSATAYRIPIAKILTLEPTVGIGFGTSDIFLSTSRGGADYVNSFTTGNFIVPLTLNITDVGKEVGIYLQYIVSAGQIGTTRITGLETEVDGLHFQPTTLTFGVKYHFMP